MKSGEAKLEGAEEQENIFKSNLNEISLWRFKSKVQKGALEKIKLLCKSQEAVTKLFNEYISIVSEANHKAKHGKGLKILTPTEMLQRLPIALAQVKAGNTSEDLLNEIWQIIYSL